MDEPRRCSFGDRGDLLEGTERHHGAEDTISKMTPATMKAGLKFPVAWTGKQVTIGFEMPMMLFAGRAGGPAVLRTQFVTKSRHARSSDLTAATRLVDRT